MAKRKIERKRRNYANLHGSKLKDSFSKEQRQSYQDERFWVLTKDDNGNGSAVIRFLPNKDEEKLPFKITYKHSLYIDAKSFIDRCPTTIGKDCPICEWNKDQTTDVVKKELKSYRKKHWIANILVISDPKNRENEGKIFLFEFGTQVFNILKETLQPEVDEDDVELGINDEKKPLFFYCPDEGANFRIKVKKDGEYPSWSRSSFMEPESIDPILDNFGMTDEDWMSQLYDLDDVVSSYAFKEYDDLKVKYFKYLKNANIDDIIDTTNFNIEEEETAEVYKKTREKVNAKMNEPENDLDGENVEDEKREKKAETSTKKTPKSEKKQKDMRNFFEKFQNDDDD